MCFIFFPAFSSLFICPSSFFLFLYGKAVVVNIVLNLLLQGDKGLYFTAPWKMAALLHSKFASVGTACDS
jgi:hypothetical protein